MPIASFSNGITRTLLLLSLFVDRPCAQRHHSCVGKNSGGYAAIGFSGFYEDGDTSHVFDFRDGTGTCQDGQPWGLAAAALGSILSWVFAFYLGRKCYPKALPALPDFAFYFLWRGWEQTLDTLVHYMALLGSTAALRGMDEESLSWCRHVGSIALIMHWWGIVACGGIQVAIALRVVLKPKVAKQIVPVWLACTYISLALSVGLWYKFSPVSVGIFGFIGPLAMLLACFAKAEYFGIFAAVVWLLMCVPVHISRLYLNNRTLLICRLIFGDCLFFLLGKKIAAIGLASRSSHDGDIELAQVRLFAMDHHAFTSSQAWTSAENYFVSEKSEKAMPMIRESDEIDLDTMKPDPGGDILPFSAASSINEGEETFDESLWEPLGYEELEPDPVHEATHAESPLSNIGVASTNKPMPPRAHKAQEIVSPEMKMRLMMEKRKEAVDETSGKEAVRAGDRDVVVDSIARSDTSAPQRILPEAERKKLDNSARRQSVGSANSFGSFDMQGSEEDADQH